MVVVAGATQLGMEAPTRANGKAAGLNAGKNEAFYQFAIIVSLIATNA